MRGSKATDDTLYAKMIETAQLAIDDGASQRDAVQTVSEAVAGVLKKHSDSVVDELYRTSSDLLSSERALEERFSRELRNIWGKAFDAYYLASYGAAEFADRFVRDNSGNNTDDVFQALVRLHDRTRRVAWEVYRLMTGGMPGGALARTRTLHELAVTAVVIAEYGRNPGSDLATRYLDHAVYGQIRLCEAESQAYILRGMAVPSETTGHLTELRNRAKELESSYPNFKDDRGWAVELQKLIPARLRRGATPTISGLRFLASQSDMSTDYAIMSAEVHAGADGLILNLEPSGEPESMIGPTMAGLCEPGMLALLNLHLCTWALITAGTDKEETPITDLLGLKTLEGLIARYVDYAEAAESVPVARTKE